MFELLPRRVKPRQDAIRWGVYMLRKQGSRLGTIQARDRDEAVKMAFKEFDIAEQDRWRINIQRE